EALRELHPAFHPERLPLRERAVSHAHEATNARSRHCRSSMPDVGSVRPGSIRDDAGVAELADAPGLGPGPFGGGGSTPLARTQGAEITWTARGAHSSVHTFRCLAPRTV